MRRSRDVYSNGNDSSTPECWQQSSTSLQEEPRTKRQRTGFLNGGGGGGGGGKCLPISLSYSDAHNSSKQQPTPLEEVQDIPVEFLSDDEDSECSEHEKMLSEEEKARRASMMQLVMGTQTRNYDPVDGRLEEMIRQSRLEAERNKNKSLVVAASSSTMGTGESSCEKASIPPDLYFDVDGNDDMSMSESAMDVDYPC